MNQTELLQLMIVNAVKDGMTQALNEALKPIKEELSKVKALNVKLLKEGVTVNQPVENNQTFNKIPRPNQNIVVSEGVNTRAVAENQYKINALKAQAAPFVSADGVLPDVDIDPGLFLLNKH